MGDSSHNKSQPKEIFGHSLFKKKPWLEDEFSLTPPDQTGFLSMRVDFENRKAKLNYADSSVPQLTLSNENTRHGSSSLTPKGLDSNRQIEVGTSKVSVGEIQQKHPSVFSLSTPINCERRSSHDFQKRKDSHSQILVEIPSKAETTVSKPITSNWKDPYNLVAKFDKFFVKNPSISTTESQSESCVDPDQVPRRKISTNVNLSVDQSVEQRNEELPLITNSEVHPTFPGHHISTTSINTATMVQERNKLTNYFFTNSMFSTAAQSAVSDLVSGGGVGVVSHSTTDGGFNPVTSSHIQTSIRSNFSGAGTEGFDASGVQVKTPKKRPKPSSLREMNFWAPQSM